MKKTILLTAICITSSIGSFAQNVNIPDANFKAFLIGNSSINTNSDTEIQVSEASAFTGSIFANNLGITNLTGLEAFTALDGLYVRDNNLGNLDISFNTDLTYVDCQNTNISSLDISNNIALTGITCALNDLTSLDVSANTALTAINCSGNNLTTLDVSNNTLLSNFSCDNNNINSLNINNNSALIYFVCGFNDLTVLDLSSCTSLAHLSCVGNNLTSLDLSNNAALGALYCAQNNISILDLGSNSALQTLNCSNNSLTILNMANGNNTNVSTFNTIGNPNLSCIQVDDVSWSTSNWTNVDPTASFSLDCNYGLGITDVNLNEIVTLFPNPASSQMTIKSEDKIISAKIIDATGRSIDVNLRNENTIDVSNLSNGVYQLQIETAKGIAIKRFIKE